MLGSVGSRVMPTPEKPTTRRAAEARPLHISTKKRNQGSVRGWDKTPHLLGVTLRTCLMEAVPHGTPGMSASAHFVAIIKGIKVQRHRVGWSCSLALLKCVGNYQTFA